MSKLSKTQFTRFCSLLSVHTGKIPKSQIKNILVSEGYMNLSELTQKGKDELVRLSTIAGLLSDNIFDDLKIKKDFDKTTSN